MGVVGGTASSSELAVGVTSYVAALIFPFLERPEICRMVFLSSSNFPNICSTEEGVKEDCGCPNGFQILVP